VREQKKPRPVRRASKDRHTDRTRNTSKIKRIGKAGLPRPIGGIPDLVENIAAKLNADPRFPSARSATNRAALHDAVLEGFSVTDVHRTWLAEIDRIARNANDIDDLRKAIAAYLRQAGIECLTEFSDETRFVVVQGNGSGACEVIQPAYIDGVTKRTILAGRVRRRQASDRKPAVPADDHKPADVKRAHRKRRSSSDELRD
jgi:hypothetical protein